MLVFNIFVDWLLEPFIKPVTPGKSEWQQRKVGDAGDTADLQE